MTSRSIGRTLTLAGIAMLAVSLSAGGATGAGKSKGKALGKLAAKQCAKERKALGNKAFGERYGKPAMPSCAGVKRPALRKASKECRAERTEIGAAAFAERYGTNRKGRNAFGKCVSGKVKAAPPGGNAGAGHGGKQGTHPGDKPGENAVAVAACRAEQADPDFAAGHGGKTFEEFYGENKNGKNAFGRCVSGKAKAPGQPSLDS